ncbi:MAG TPA: M48 family metalloprotease [Acidimicrobiales bacterium]
MVAAPVVARVDRTAELAEEAAASANRRKALRLCIAPGAALGALLGIIVALVGLPLIALLVLVVVTVAVAAWIWSRAPHLVLGSLGAVPSSEDDHPRLHNLVDGLCATMGLDRPAIRVLVSDVPNAVALGRDPKSATLVVTSGLEQSLGLVELEGVLAHELVHIKRQDTVLSAVAVVVALPWAMVRGTPAGARAVHELVGRGREFSADQRAALIVRYPTGIASALEAMVASSPTVGGWPPAPGRVAALTRWLWVDPMAGAAAGESSEGNLDDTRVRAATLTELSGARARTLG